MIIRDIIFSTTPPALHNVLWIKAGDNNINTLYVYDGGWRKIGISSGGGTSDYNDLENKPRINDVVLEGNLTLQELGIILPDLSKYVTEESLNKTLQSYAKKSDVPSVEGLLSKTEAESTYQKRGNYALKSEIPDTSNFITEIEVNDKLEGYAKTTDIPDTSNLATKDELNSAISGQKFKTINGQEITGEGNIEISGGSITVDDKLSETSTNPVQNKVISEELKSMSELLSKLDEKIFPTTLIVSGGGTFEDGTSQTIEVTWKLQKDGKRITPDTVDINGESVDPSNTYKEFTDVTTTTTYNVTVTYKGKTYKGSTTATFNKTYYRYHGAAPLDTDFNNLPDEVIKSFIKTPTTGKGADNVSINIPVEGICTYIYPIRFGKLTQVQDVNAGGAPSDSWVISTPSLTPEPFTTKIIDGEECYIYRNSQPNYENTFRFNFK